MMKTKNKDAIIFGAIYLIVLVFMLVYNFTHPVINDGVYEYRGYLLNIKEGWLYRYSSINSVLVSIWFPAMLQRMTGIDPMVMYRVFPPLFYALAPAFSYLIARRYLSTQESAVASLVVIFSSYILFFPDLGRMGVVLGLLAGLIWAVLGNKLLTSMTLALLVVFAHYGTTAIATGLMAVILVYKLTHNGSAVKVTAVTLCVLIFFTGTWHFGISHYSGDSMLWTLLHPGEARGVLEDYIPGVRVDVPEGGFFELKSRDYVTQEAFGQHFFSNSTPLRIEILANWMIVGFMILGLYLMYRDKKVEGTFKVVLLTMFVLTAISVIVPSISVFYGTQRVYFTATLVLATCVPVGIRRIAHWIPISPTLLSVIVLAIYGISTSGLMYLLFGLEKVLPVVLTLPQGWN